MRQDSCAKSGTVGSVEFVQHTTRLLYNANHISCKFRKKDAEEPSISQFTFLLKSFQSQLPAPFAKIPGLSLDALESCPTPLIEASKHEANSSLSKRASIVPLDDDQYYIRP